MIPTRLQSNERCRVDVTISDPGDIDTARLVLDQLRRKSEAGANTHVVVMETRMLGYLVTWAERGLRSRVRHWYAARILAGAGLALLGWGVLTFAVLLAGGAR